MQTNISVSKAIVVTQGCVAISRCFHIYWAAPRFQIFHTLKLRWEIERRVISLDFDLACFILWLSGFLGCVEVQQRIRAFRERFALDAERQSQTPGRNLRIFDKPQTESDILRHIYWLYFHCGTDSR